MMKKVINFYKNLSFGQGVAVAITLSSVIGIAATVGPLTTFSPGTPISSSQVNANFTTLKTAVQNIAPSQIYLGNHDASTAVDPTGATVTGEYFIISVAGTIGGVTYAVGDWMMFDGTVFNKVAGNSVSVFGRTGAVTATEGDYNLSLLTDVTIVSPSNGQYLSYNGSQWVNTSLSVQNFAMTVLPSCTPGQFLFGNGSTLSCVAQTWGQNGANIYFQTGNVGIGWTTPNEALDVAGNMAVSGKIINGNGGPSMPSYTNVSQSTGMFFSGSDIGFSSSSVEKMRILSSGNVGIGTSAPTYKLDVQGGDINASGAVRAATIALTSDRRLKKNIFQIESSLEKILGFRGVEFDWIKNGTHDIGVIAQEVEKIVPTLVMTDSSGIKSVKYANMAGLLIESTRELNEKITALESENTMLKNYLCSRDQSAPFCE